ncbi:hypothetical protein [Sphingobacterium sp. LRF_L2]|uniref:hypothetical protein n=1 Tax=Sphingobacterium sp. LRF_L2 TaxID=3369421 RepID=UPI003F5D839E
MKLTIYSKDNLTLFNEITPSIRSGELKTWEVIERDNGSVCYNYTPQQWSEKVLLLPELGTGCLIISTRYWRDGYVPNEDMKAYVLSRFLEILLVHFREGFDSFKVEK